METEAQKYIKDHKNALTKEGKTRIPPPKTCSLRKDGVETVKTANDQAVAAAQVLKAAKGDGLWYEMIAEVDKMQKSSPPSSSRQPNRSAKTKFTRRRDGSMRPKMPGS